MPGKPSTTELHLELRCSNSSRTDETFGGARPGVGGFPFYLPPTPGSLCHRDGQCFPTRLWLAGVCGCLMSHVHLCELCHRVTCLPWILTHPDVVPSSGLLGCAEITIFMIQLEKLKCPSHLPPIPPPPRQSTRKLITVMSTANHFGNEAPEIPQLCSAWLGNLDSYSRERGSRGHLTSAVGSTLCPAS